MFFLSICKILIVYASPNSKLFDDMGGYVADDLSSVASGCGFDGRVLIRYPLSTIIRYVGRIISISAHNNFAENMPLYYF